MTEQRALARDAWLMPDVHRSPAAVVAKPRMLCATDLSEQSERVVTRAAVMANQLDAMLAFLHVIAPEAESSVFAAVSDRMERQLNSIRPPLRRAPAIRLRAGDDVPTIAAVANETGADLVVLGSERRKPLVPLISAFAGELAALARRPVLIVRRDSAAQYGSVLIAAEQSAGFDQVLRIAASMRLLECESVAIIHGFEAPFRGPRYASGFDPHASKRNVEEWELAARRRLLQNFDATGLASDHFRVLFVQSRPIREIQREVRRVVPDLLVIATKDYAALDRVMRANAGNDALRNIECDVLLVPIPWRRTDAGRSV
jgi:universal stress protein E